MGKNTEDFKWIFIKKSENGFPVTINMTHYKLEQQIIEQKVENTLLDEWFDSKELPKLELISEPAPNEETGMYEFCFPIEVFVYEPDIIKKSDVLEIIKEFHKEYNFREIESKFILLDRTSWNMIVGDITGSYTNDTFSAMYKSMRKDIFIPMMAQALFNITRTDMKARFYDLKGYYSTIVKIGEKKYKDREYYR